MRRRSSSASAGGTPPTPAVQGLSCADCSLSGWVRKAPSSGMAKKVNMWNDRWLEVRGHYLYYYTDAPHGVVDLRECDVDADHRDGGKGWTVRSEGMRPWRMWSDRRDQPSAERWVVGLREAALGGSRQQQRQDRVDVLEQGLLLEQAARWQAEVALSEARERCAAVSAFAAALPRAAPPTATPLRPPVQVVSEESDLMQTCLDIASPAEEPAGPEVAVLDEEDEGAEEEGDYDCGAVDLERVGSDTATESMLFSCQEFRDLMSKGRGTRHMARCATPSPSASPSAAPQVAPSTVAAAPPAAAAAPPAPSRRRSHPHPELPADFGASCPEKCKGVALSEWDFRKPQPLQQLSEGAGLFAFACKTGDQLSRRERQQAGSLINLSFFKDETADNGVPHIDCGSEEDIAQYTLMLTQATYLVPAMRPGDVTAQRIASVEYHRASQVPGTKVWDDTPPFTFRITKVIVPYVFKMTIQFRVSEVPEAALESLRVISYGLPIHKAILLERTKRDVKAQDATKKAKSILLYHFLPGDRGALVTNFTCIANTSIPRVIASMMNSMGAKGSKEVGVTAQLARQYFARLRRGGAK
eukprot:TRINITY_DN12097_c0_g1_i1.p1 TRINITY_DN12097_c0_g1~~TRINITY_DN12097_c0_g1_i1.p1  ORF type:complete len:615 (+),score=134.05 TRINITY_DN12097_c0_g1_i1:93-1847(+)